MKRNMLWKRVAACVMAAGMVITTPRAVWSFEIAQAEGTARAETPQALNLKEADTKLDVGTEWAGCQAIATEAEKAVTMEVTSFGWNGEWGIQYFINNAPVEDNKEYKIEFDITSTVDKTVFFKVERKASSQGLGEKKMELKAGETFHYSEQIEAATYEVKNFIFAMGNYKGEEAQAGIITIENITVTDLTGTVTPDPKGPEYDFTADNSGKDTEDPGKTKSGYDLIWADEFDGNYGANAHIDEATGLNLDYWEAELGDGSIHNNQGWGNKELQCYTGRAENVGVNEKLSKGSTGDGMLRITAKYEDNGYVYAGESSKKYTSARLRTTSETQAKINTTYGYVEARIALPETKGAWPAFWMLPESTDIYGSWPISGEIDIMETTGINTKKACGTLHWGAPEHVYKGSGYVDLKNTNGIQYFHTYAVDWEPGKITWYYDGIAVKTMSTWKGAFSNASDSLTFDAPFDQPFYILLNLAVDSGEFGGADNKASFHDDINMYVDYVRLYQKSNGYPDYAERGVDDDAKKDWANYAGQNQIAEITDSTLESAAGGNVNAIETGNAVEAKWYLGYQEGGAAELSAEDIAGRTWAKLAISSAGSKDYSSQLIGHYNAKAGYTYKVSFDAYADGGMVGKNVSCDSKEWKEWSTYGIQSFTLSNQPAHTEFVFAQSEDFNNCRIEFNLGAAGTGNVYISNVKVEIVDPAKINEEKPHRVLSDGNVIFNGTFDQGSRYTGYWTAETGTTLTVSRYTTEKIAESDVKVYDYASTKNSFEHNANGIKYYERRAQISAASGTPAIYQSEIPLKADSYTLKMDMYSAANTTVTASVLDDSGTVAAAKTFNYSAADKVKTLTWKFTTTADISSATLKLSFGAGAAVQIDNVSMLGESQGEYVDPHPMNQETTWAFDGTGTLVAENGVLTATGLTSGSYWFAPQIISSDYLLVEGKEYTLKFKAKLEGDVNGSFEYIIQENAGGWYVFGAEGRSKLFYDSTKADADGFCTYEITFTAGRTLSNVHTVFGFGNSAADNAAITLKDIRMDLKQESDTSGGPVVSPGTSVNAPAANTPVTVTEVKADGTVVKTMTEQKADGTVKTTVTETAADGSEVKKVSETVINTEGKKVEVTTTTKTDAQGKVEEITAKSQIEGLEANAKATVTVKEDGNGNITSAKATVTKQGEKTASGTKGTISASSVKQITEAAGTMDVVITQKVMKADGTLAYQVQVKAEDVVSGEKLYIVKVNSKTGEKVLVNAKTYKVTADGSVSVTVDKKGTYELLEEEAMEEVTKEILKTVKVKKSSRTVKKGKKTTIELSSKLNMDNVKKVTYTTSRKSVASVSKNGKVTAKKPGTATVKVKVTLKNGVTKTVKVKIKVK